ncbi:MAG TPA: CidA/LrgA family protein [Candidatus Merdivicinus faecavium]|nr:CidA/LrgA family protein [Candidatus Merdivicinus faecavium]
MKILAQIALIFGVCLIGEGIARFLPLPGSVVSMVLLFLLLLCRVVKPAQVEGTADFLLRNMAFFFIPAGVAVMESAGLLWENLLPFLAVCLITLVVTFAATALAVRFAIWLQGRLFAGKGGVKRD